MFDPSGPEAEAELLFERAFAGDERARSRLFAGLYGPLLRATRRRLRAYPGVRCAGEADDIVQSGLCRRLRVLRRVRPATARELLALALTCVERSLRDRAHFYARRTWRCTHARLRLNGAVCGPEQVPEAPDSSDGLDDWAALQEAIFRLPAAVREAAHLTLHHGWTQAQIAEQFLISPRAVRVRLKAASDMLRILC